jgi:hypothetical protein
MIAFRRHSTCPTLPDLIRDAAEARSARWARMTPVEIWTRPSTTLLLRTRGNLPVAPCGVVHVASAPDADRLRDEGQRFVAAALLATASLVLCVGRSLLRARLITPGDAALAVQWSVWLTRHGLRLWRRGRSRGWR